jgi:hypothetical protein
MRLLTLSTFVACLATAVSYSASGQTSITYPIPANALMASQIGQSNNNSTYWLCSTGGSTIQGNSNEVFIDRMGELRISGNSNTVYTKNYGVIYINGNNNVIHASMCPNIVVTGNNNEIYTLASIPVTFNGRNNTRITIANLYFNYSQAPNGGVCNVTTSTLNNQTKTGLLLVPNPAQKGFAVKLPPGAQGPVIVSDLLGRRLASFPTASQTLLTDALPIGLCHVSFLADGKAVTLPLIVQ